MNPTLSVQDYLASQVAAGKLEYPRRAKNDSQNSHAEVLKAAWFIVHGFSLSGGAAEQELAGFCAHSDSPWTASEIAHKVREAEKSSCSAPGFLLRDRPRPAQAAPRPPMAPKKKVERAEWAKVNRGAAEQFCAGVPELDFAWFSRRSPVDVSKVGTGDFLSALFGFEEKVLIFTNYYSQGDMMFWRGEFFRLSPQEGVKAVRCDAPRSGRKGVWYLVQPVSGRWEIGDRVKDGVRLKTRRSEGNVAGWRHLVLESDEADFEGTWLRVVARLNVPIAALYTSGGRSIHALVRYPVGTKAEWDHVKGTMQQVVCPLGADPGALSAVRLSRLPGCFREGTDGDSGYVKYARPRMQELIYLNPNPTFDSIFSAAEVRS